MKPFLPYISGKRGFYGLIVLLVLLSSIYIALGGYYLILVPFVVFFLFLAFVSADILLFITVFTVPLSVPLEKFYPALGFNMQLPSETLILLLMGVFILKVLSNSNLDKRIIQHPISIAIYVYLIWMFIACICSTMPMVSFKLLVSRIWFITVFYFMAAHLFRSRKNIRRYFWMYFSAFSLVVAYSLVRTFSKGVLDQYAAQHSAYPFFPDHTSYGAIIAMVLPFIAGFAFYHKYPRGWRSFIFIVLVGLVFALILSYTRAAWISVFVALLVCLLFLFRIKLIYVTAIVLIGLGIIYAKQTEIKLSLEQNQQDSSKDLQKHLKSIYNIRNDVSNLERINRWNSAFRMFEEKPIFGWGPGTYMFKYAPFQVAHDKTPISTNRGDWGNAHSEFIGPLAESGLPGMLTFIGLLITVFYVAVKRYFLISGKPFSRLVLLCATLGLVTYVAHGFLNNFLDTDKASALFWGYIAMVVAIEIYHSDMDKVKLQS